MMPSEGYSLLFLSALLVAALILAARLKGRAVTAERVLPPACLTLALQALHVAEEYSAGFHIRAPRMLGLAPWSGSYFVWVNMAAIAAWSIAIGGLASGRASVWATALLWFLAIASIGNAIWHPAASLLTGGYFPGTVTAPLLGIGGLLLARSLAKPQGPRHGPPRTSGGTE